MVNYPVSMQFVRICCSLIYHCMIQIIILLILAHDQLCLSHQVHNTILRKEISENLKTLYSSLNSFLVFCLFSYHFFLKEYSDCKYTLKYKIMKLINIVLSLVFMSNAILVFGSPQGGCQFRRGK